MVQNGLATQITMDHSYINELIRNGTLTAETAQTADLHGYESVITRAIGVSETVEPDYYSIDLTPGTQILIATDGLTRYLQGDEIATILQATPFESACANLIDLAKRRGGHDNITCLLMLVLTPETAAQPDTNPDPQPAA
jgi:protein phosphatase